MGLVTTLHTEKAKAVLGIDASTHSFAFALFDGESLVRWGKINFAGATTYDRLADAQRKIDALIEDVRELEVDYIAIEKAIYANSTDTAIKMGMIVGVVIATLYKNAPRVVEVAPISWQSYIGNKNYNATQKAAVAKKYPKKSTSWYRNKIREERKEFTMNYFNKKFGCNIDDNDVADAVGIGWFAVNHLTHG